jgi:hypothetical protein
MRNTWVIVISSAVLIGLLSTFAILSLNQNDGADLDSGSQYASDGVLNPFGGSGAVPVKPKPAVKPKPNAVATTTVSVTLLGGQTVVIPDFTKTPQPEGDTHVPEQGYLIAENRDTGYEITYFSSTDAQSPYILVSLKKEPLGVTRMAAEAELRTLFSLSDEELCLMPDAEVWVNRSVNEYYSGMDLGFSFCPDAVLLPTP